MAGSSARKFEFKVEPTLHGQRLDQVIAARVPDISRRKARAVLTLGGVFVDKRRVKVASKKVFRGQTVAIFVGGALEPSKQGAALWNPESIVTLHEDEDILVINKPAGVLSAPTPESDRNNLADELGRARGMGDLFVVQRLDLHTSGVMVFAKTAQANEVLSAAFREHQHERQYTAFVHGAFPAETTLMDSEVQGKMARTHVMNVQQVTEDIARLTLRLETGRTHQIRIHCAAVGHPVVGDSRYGAPRTTKVPRIALHAQLLGMTHPVSGEPLTFVAPLADDLANWATSLT